MKQKEFDDFLHQRLNSIKTTLISKGEEYQHGDDEKFINFINAGIKLGVTPMQALMGMKVKHTVSIDDLIGQVNYGIEVTSDRIIEKLEDEICYLLLLEAMLLEQNNSIIDANIKVKQPFKDE
jgi:hypothetical protein